MLPQHPGGVRVIVVAASIVVPFPNVIEIWHAPVVVA